MRTLILHTLPPASGLASGDSGRVTGEFDLCAAAWNIAAVLPDAAVAGVRGDPREVLAALDAHTPGVVFNLCEAPLGRPALEPHIAALFEWLGVPFTGASSQTLALCLHKPRANAVLAAHGVPVPPSGGFPCIVKPAAEDGSAWLFPHSVCDDAAALALALERLPAPALVQNFLPGREFAVSVWGPGGSFVSVGETRFLHGLRLITYAAKWDLDSPDFANSPLDYDIPLDPPLRHAVEEIARAAWRAVGAFGYLRLDIRLDADGQPHVLDVNPNPELGPGVGICRAVQEAGWTWERFVRSQLESGTLQMTVRDLTPADRDDVREALIASAAFNPDEIRVALEMVDSCGYSFPAIEIEGRVRAYACAAPAGLTLGSWYLYWICVHPDYQGRGVGRALQQRVEEIVRGRGGDRLVLETSGRPDYARTRRFYEALGYCVCGSIPGFYKPGDDCIIYYKVLA